ncbi:MAG: 50S ribosomal protein L35 [Anaerolineae bacterium]
MPKLKTHKSTSKRFRISKGGKGKLMRTRQGKGHFRRNKRKAVRSMFDEMHVVTSAGTKRRVQRLVPYLHEKS